MQKQEKKLDSLKMFRDLVKSSVKTLKNSDMIPGSMVSFSYNAKDKTKVWDKTPLTIVLRRSKGYTLGLNFHWVPTKIRSVLIDYILKKNKKRIDKGLSIEINYKEVRQIIISLKLRNVVRLYINSRISKKGIKIPEQFMRKAVFLPSENFIGISAETAYAIMNKKAKSKKGR